MHVLRLDATMDSKDGSALYSSVLDAFGSDVGSSLVDLATDWESPTNESETTGGMDEIGKRMAKPLYFFNPVFTMFYKDVQKEVTHRQILIPIKQTDTEDGKHGTGHEKSKHKSHSHGHGILSKLTGIGRRHSKTKLIESPDLSLPPLHDEAIQRANSVSLPERTPHDDQNPAQAAVPAKEATADNLVEKSSARPRSFTVDDAGRVRSSVRVSTGTVQDPPPFVASVQETEVDEKAEDSKSTPSGSFSSGQSDDMSVSDEPVTTMADVLSEISRDESGGDVRELRDVAQDAAKEVNLLTAEEPPPLLKRNNTLKWSGSRKAPALIREFTRRQKQQQNVNQEVEATLSSSNRIMTEGAKNRPCTPSEQTTSFGMGEDRPPSTPKKSPKSSPNKAMRCVREDEEASGDELLSPVPETKPTSPHKASGGSSSKRDSAFIMLSSLLPPAPRLRRTRSSKVRAYLQKLGSTSNTALGYAVNQFVQTTLENKEKRPLVLLHDVRSFLTDIKRYIIANPQLGMVNKIQKICNSNSIADVEGAVDDALDKLVLYPLHKCIYRCLVVDYVHSGQMNMMEEAIVLAKNKSNQDLGIRPTLIPPNAESLEVIKGYFARLQNTYSPYYKLKELLMAVTKIYESTHDLNNEDKSARRIGADDFLPLLVHSIVKCNFVGADIETQYIDGLLDPALLLGEGGYYLTTLISAVQVILSIKRREAALPNISDLQGFLKVGISSVRKKGNAQTTDIRSRSDSGNEIVFHKTLHVPPSMTAHNLCQMISRKFHVHMAKEHCLHVVLKGVPYPLEPNECPQLVKMDLLTQYPVSAFYFSFQRKREKPTTNDSNVTAANEEPSNLASDQQPPAATAVVDDDQVEVTSVEIDQSTVATHQSKGGTVGNDDVEDISKVDTPHIDSVEENGENTEKSGSDNYEDAPSDIVDRSDELTADIPNNTDIISEHVEDVAEPASDSQVEISSEETSSPTAITPNVHVVVDTCDESANPSPAKVDSAHSYVPADVPVISVSDFLITSPATSAYQAAAPPSKDSSRSSSTGDVFATSYSPRGVIPGRENVASLTEYFESKRVEGGSPTWSPKHQ